MSHRPKVIAPKTINHIHFVDLLLASLESASGAGNSAPQTFYLYPRSPQRHPGGGGYRGGWYEVFDYWPYGESGEIPGQRGVPVTSSNHR